MQIPRLPRAQGRALARAIALGGLLPLLAACADLTGKGYKYGSLGVTVVDGEGGPLSGVALELFNDRWLLAYGATDATGAHFFRFVPRNTVGVRAFPPAGYRVPDGAASQVEGLYGGRRDPVVVEFVFHRDSAGATAAGRTSPP